MKYHAHIYFPLEQMTFAQSLYERCPFGPLRFFDKKVGPHALPMFEIQFTDLDKEEVLAWVGRECRGLSILVHQDTGDDYRDHTEGFFWIGERLKIDFKFFDLVQSKPHLSIH